MSTVHKRLGEILIAARKIDQTHLSAALADQKVFGGRLGSHLVRMGFISEENLIDVLALQISIPKVNLAQSHIRVDALALVKKEICLKYCLIPVMKKVKNGMINLLVAMNDPTDIAAINAVEFAGDCRVSAAIATEGDIHRAINHCYAPTGLRESLGEQDWKGISVDLDSGEKLDFEIISADDEGSLKRYDIDPTLRNLLYLLVKKKIISWEEAHDLLKTAK
jgi:hypothetical protein